jgi:hypothetical protein
MYILVKYSSTPPLCFLVLTVYLGMANTSDFVLKKEDHTLGNLLSEHLKAHPNVMMAGYKSEFPPNQPFPISATHMCSRAPQRAGALHTSANGWNSFTT